MPPRAKPRIPQGRYGKHRFDPSKPLFVVRRLAGAHDESGRQTIHLPGDTFPVSSVPARRLEALFSARFLSHDRPRFASTAAPLPDVPANLLAEHVEPQAAKGKRARVNV